MVKEQLEALEELARIDQGFRQIDVEQKEIDAHLEELRSDVARMRDLLEREKAQLADTERLRTQTAADIVDLGERVAKSTTRNHQAKNNREREATARELEVLRREKEERTAKVAELDTVITQVRDSLVRHADDVEKLVALLGTEETESKDRVEGLAVRRKEQQAVRSAMTSRVRSDVLQKYNQVRERRGNAIAVVEGGVCRGCHLALPPQLTARLYNPRELHQCPNCMRFLVLRTASSTRAGV